MKKKPNLLNLINPLNKLTREPSLKMLITDKEIIKKRNVSTDFLTTPIKSQKKIVKRNIRKNSFNNLIFNKTQDINKTGVYNLSYIPSHKLILNNNFSLYKKNKDKLSKKNPLNTNNKSFNFSLINKSKILNFNQAKPSIIKKNSKKFRINTQSFLDCQGNKNHKTVSSINNTNENYNKDNSILNSYINNNQICYQTNKINSKDKIIDKKGKLIKNSKKKSDIKTNKKIKKNNKKNLSTNFKISTDDFLKIIKNSKTNYFINKDKVPPLQEKNHSLALSNKNIPILNEGNIKLICENIKLKRKNDELISKINYISREFNEIKKDNNDIKEELKEKNNILNNIKLTMDIFNQELVRLQNQIKNNANEKNKLKNLERVKKLVVKGKEINENNEMTPSTGLGYQYDKKTPSNEIIVINNSNESEKNLNYTVSDENNISLADNININQEEYKKALNNCQNKILNNNNYNAINNFNIIKKKQKENEENFNDFNQEFLKNIDNFSESWRKEVEKMMQRKGNTKKYE